MQDYFRKHVLENHIVIALFVVLLALIVHELRGVLVSLFLAYILMAAFSPLVDFLVHKGIRRGLSVVLVYFLFLITLVLIILPLIPFVIAQFQSLAVNFPDYLSRIGAMFGIGGANFDLQGWIQAETDAISKNAFSLTSKFFGGVFSLLTTLVVSVYLLIEKEKFRHGLLSLFSTESKVVVEKIINNIDNLLGAWVRGQLTLSFSIGLATWIGLTILRVPFALPLAVIAGFLEAIPMVGPIVSAVPAVVVAMTVSPALSLAVVGLYIIVQQTENHLLVPKVMQKALGLSPVIVILAIAAGGQILGIVGAILAIPMVLVVTAIVRGLTNDSRSTSR